MTLESSPLRIVIVGAGPIGLGVAKEIAARPSYQLRAVVDVDPNKHGFVVEGVPITAEIPTDADVAVLTTTSSLQKLEPLVVACAEKKLSVVSTCEELAWPWSMRELATRIDEVAKKNGIAVLGTGVNPGFLMDALPLALTAPCRRVDSIRVERVQDASARRRPFQDKVGVGMAPDVVLPRLREGHTGHVGLKESAAMVAARLKLDVDTFEEDAQVVVADREIELHGRIVKPGQVLGVEQKGVAKKNGTPVIELHFRATFGEAAPRDRIVIEGEPRLDVVFQGGVPGDIATCALVANAIPVVRAATPGLRTMADVPLVTWVR
jgi:hypothetical protein